MPRNPSELARLEEELKETIQNLLERTASKGTKQRLINELRNLERQLGYKGEDYNNGNFRPYYENLLWNLNNE